MLILLLFPVLLREFLLVGMLIWLLRILWGLVFLLTLPVGLVGKMATGSRWDFFVGCPNALAASDACFVTDRWFTPHFSVVARFLY